MANLPPVDVVNEGLTAGRDEDLRGRRILIDFSGDSRRQSGKER